MNPHFSPSRLPHSVSRLPLLCALATVGAVGTLISVHVAKQSPWRKSVEAASLAITPAGTSGPSRGARVAPGGPPAATAFHLPAHAEPSTPFTLVTAFPELRFVDPVLVLPIPGRAGELAVVERRGLVYAVATGEKKAARRILLDIRPGVRQRPHQAEEGLLGVAFHPSAAAKGDEQRPYLYAYYTAEKPGDERLGRLARFDFSPNGSAIDPASETVLIEQPLLSPAHNAGHVAFGPDGFLYLSLGDDSRERETTQQIDRSLHAGILRLDVDCRGGTASHAPPKQPSVGRTANYYIPNDNPFVGQANVLEEYFALGLRNPWRFSFDRSTGQLWATDVGDKLYESILLLEGGANAGWPYREGPMARRTFYPEAAVRPERLIGHELLPVSGYTHNGMQIAVIGGYVYRGHQFPQLVGKYIYADQTGAVYALGREAGGQVAPPELLAVLGEPGVGISSFGETADGELYVCAIAKLEQETSQIFAMEVNRRRPDEAMPARLSQTGLFVNLQTLEPQPQLVPFDVVSPLWSDGADKQRWIAVPPGTQIQGELGGPWEFPAGTVLVKNFELALDERDDAPRRRLETRVLVLDAAGGVYGGSYRWTEDHSDALLVTTYQTEELHVTTADGEQRTQEWLYPGCDQCANCHNRSAGYVLGFRPKQLNRLTYDAEHRQQTGQLARLRNLGLLAANFPDEAVYQLPRLAAIDDPSASIEHRVRCYLDTNCSCCHRAELHYAAFDARRRVPLADTGLVGGTAYHQFASDGQDQIVSPGHPERSLLYLRMNTTAVHERMPPLGRHVVDEQAVALVREWIQSLSPPPRALAVEPRPEQKF